MARRDLAGGVGVESDHGVDRAVAGVDATDRLLDQVDGVDRPGLHTVDQFAQHRVDATGAPTPHPSRSDDKSRHWRYSTVMRIG